MNFESILVMLYFYFSVNHKKIPLSNYNETFFVLLLSWLIFYFITNFVQTFHQD